MRWNQLIFMHDPLALSVWRLVARGAPCGKLARTLAKARGAVNQKVVW
jgi:hypothetical protein